MSLLDIISKMEAVYNTINEHITKNEKKNINFFFMKWHNISKGRSYNVVQTFKS